MTLFCPATYEQTLKNICASLLSPRSHALRFPYDGDFRMCVMRYKSKYFNPFFVTLFKKSKRAWSFWAVKQIVSQNRLFFRYLICFSWGLFEICEGIEGKNRRWKQREETSKYFLINLFCEAFCFTPHTKSYRICFIKQTYIYILFPYIKYRIFYIYRYPLKIWFIPTSVLIYISPQPILRYPFRISYRR